MNTSRQLSGSAIIGITVVAFILLYGAGMFIHQRAQAMYEVCFAITRDFINCYQQEANLSAVAGGLALTAMASIPLGIIFYLVNRKRREPLIEAAPQVIYATDPLCPLCQHPNRVGARFCGNCGKALSVPSPLPTSVPPPIASLRDGSVSSRRWIWAVVGLVILVVGFGAYMLYRINGDNAYAAGLAAQQRDDCSTAQTHYLQVLDVYRFSMSQSVESAQINRDECQFVLDADKAIAGQAYEAALSGYQSYLQKYPAGFSNAAMRQRASRAHLQAAAQSRAAKSYETALNHYRALLQEFTDSPQGQEATKNYAPTYTEWGLDLRRQRLFDQALELYAKMNNDARSGLTSDQYNQYRADTFIEWGKQLEQEGKFAQALELV